VKTEDVEAFMDRLDHPFKAEVQALREIIKASARTSPTWTTSRQGRLPSKMWSRRW
jgi:hypothetical protein